MRRLLDKRVALSGNNMPDCSPERRVVRLSFSTIGKLRAGFVVFDGPHGVFFVLVWTLREQVVVSIFELELFLAVLDYIADRGFVPRQNIVALSSHSFCLYTRSNPAQSAGLVAY